MQGQIAAQLGLGNSSRVSLFMVLKKQILYNPQTVRRTMEYQDHTVIKSSVATLLPSLLLWTARLSLRHYLSLHKLRRIVRSSVLVPR